uniref:Thap domain protein n=1 Tax=Rhipicephalus appendiculatus TaxID=34631 RepID=A0A131Z1R4_RHIAP
MPACCAPNCTSRPEKSSGKTFHAFPRSKPQIFKKWLVNLKREKWRPSPGHRLCSDHFAESCFIRTGARTRLLADAVPTLFSFPDDSDDSQKNIPERRAPKRRGEILDLTPEDEPPMSPAAPPPEDSDKMLDHDCAVSGTPEVLKRRLDKCTDVIEKIKNKLELSEQREHRLNNKVTSLSEIIYDLKSELLASNDACAMLELLAAAKDPRAISLTRRWESEQRNHGPSLNLSGSPRSSRPLC